VAAGGFASYALSRSGQLWSWGSNAMGQCGTGFWGWDSHKPCVVEKISDGRLVSVCVLCLSGARLTWHCRGRSDAVALLNIEPLGSTVFGE
jgi:alpha-tubulin suppressor-like RCC1 family protein